MKTIATLIAALLATTAFVGPCHAAPSRLDATRHIVVVGDSITGGAGTSNPDRFAWPTWLGLDRVTTNGGCIVTPNCFGGVPSAASTYERDVLSKAPDVVVIGFGINDLTADAVSVRDILAAIESMAAQNDALGIETYVATVTPVRGIRVRNIDPERRHLNNLIRATFGDHVIDFDRALVGPNGKLQQGYDSGDKLHPNAHAYKVMAKVAAGVLTQQR